MGRFVRALKSGSFDEIIPGWAAPPSGYLGRSMTGQLVSHESATTVSVVNRCINLIGGTLAKLPLQLYRDLPEVDGKPRGRERATDIPEYSILHDRPSSEMTSFTWRKTAMFHLLSWGNSYSEIVRNGFGELVELATLRPDRMEVKWEGGERVYYYRNGDGVRIRMKQDQVFHVAGLGFNGLVGFPPLTMMRETLGSYGAAREYGASFFRNGGRPAVVVTHPKTMSAPAIERLTAQMDRLRGSGNAGKTVLIEEGGNFKDLGFPPEDAQFIQTKDHELNEFATWFGVPPHMVGLTDRSTSWGTGIEQQTLGFFNYTMDDWFVNWEQEIRARLLWGTDITAEFNRNAMLRGDTLQRLQAYQLGRNMGMWSPNDLLMKENENPRTDPGGDEFLRPLNYIAEGSEDGLPVIRTISVAPPTLPVEDEGANPRVLSGITQQQGM